MAILSKEALLGATDLVEREVDLRPAIDGSVIVRSLPASYSNDAQSEALEVVTDPRTGKQTANLNTRKLEELQVLHGLVNPKLETLDEVRRLGEQLGSSWRRIIEVLDEISGVNKESVERTARAFQPGGQPETGILGSNGTPAGSSRPDLDVPVGA